MPLKQPLRVFLHHPLEGVIFLSCCEFISNNSSGVISEKFQWRMFVIPLKPFLVEKKIDGNGI